MNLIGKDVNTPSAAHSTNTLPVNSLVPCRGAGHLRCRTKSKIIRLGIANQIEYFLAKLFGVLSGKIQKSSEASRGTKLERNGGMAP